MKSLGVCDDEHIHKLVGNETLFLYVDGAQYTVDQCITRQTLFDVPECSYGIKNNFTSITDPTIYSDQSEGYGSGSLWINQTSIRVFICISALPNEAMWLNLTPP